jgi:IPT/TIG domain
VTELQQELTSINGQISAASTAPAITPPTLTPTTAGAPPETANTFSDFLSKLPSGIQQDINSQLQSPSLPATKQLDNFITLLYERLAREVSALQDDVMRDPQNAAFLVQFDVGLYPSNEAKDRVAKVEFTLHCDRCKVYSIYPGQSSYNLANYEGASKRNNIFFSLATLFGFGINADYRRQEDTLRGDIVQSVYMAGFQQGTVGQAQDFGWYYGSAPFEKLVTPGMRSTFAIITVPRDLIEQAAGGDCTRSLCEDGNGNIQLPIRVDAGWAKRDDPSDSIGKKWSVMTVTLPGADNLASSPVVLRERDHLHVLGMEYNPVYSAVTKPSAPGNTPPTPPPGTAQATASGAGTGSATVTVSGAGTASASSTGTSAATATATATPQWVMGTGDGLAVAPPGSTENLNKLPDGWLLDWPLNWDEASRTHQMQLVMNINKADLASLPEHRPIDVLRGLDRVGRLPDLWSALLPTKLTAKYISATQFSLEGTNAGAIDAVSLQGPSDPNTVLQAAGGTDFVLVTLPSAKADSGGNSAASKPAITDVEQQDGDILITGTGFGKKGTVKIAGKASARSICWSDANVVVPAPAGLAAGSKVPVTVATTAGTSAAFSFAVTTAGDSDTKPTCPPQQSSALAAGTYTVLPLVALDDKKQYLPLDVTDKDGNPLTFSVPAQTAKADNTSSDQSGKTTTITITKKTTGDQTAGTTATAKPPASNSK